MSTVFLILINPLSLNWSLFYVVHGWVHLWNAPLPLRNLCKKKDANVLNKRNWLAVAEILLHLVQDTVTLLSWDLLRFGVSFHATAHPVKTATHLVGDTQNPFKFSIWNMMVRFFRYNMTLIFHAFIYIWQLATSVSMQEEQTAHPKVFQLFLEPNILGFLKHRKERSDRCYNTERTIHLSRFQQNPHRECYKKIWFVLVSMEYPFSFCPFIFKSFLN